MTLPLLMVTCCLLPAQVFLSPLFSAHCSSQGARGTLFLPKSPGTVSKLLLSQWPTSYCDISDFCYPGGLGQRGFLHRPLRMSRAHRVSGNPSFPGRVLHSVSCTSCTRGCVSWEGVCLLFSQGLCAELPYGVCEHMCEPCGCGCDMTVGDHDTVTVTEMRVSWAPPVAAPSSP